MDTSLSGADGYLDVTVFQSLFKEASIMAAFEHENVLSLRYITIDKRNRPGLISDFMDMGDLKNYLANEKLVNIEYKQLVRFAEFAARGMEYLASKGRWVDYPKLVDSTKLSINIKFRKIDKFRWIDPSQGVIHRDLAARNCLLETKGGRLNLKIADFGLSKAVDNIYNAEMEYRKEF